MNRVVIEEIGTGILWDAVQAKGWTEPQLARIQRAWQGEPILRDVISAIHTERLLRIKYYEFIRRGSYRQWQNLYCDLLAGYGCHPVLPPYAVEVWRQYLFHPLWSFAWADQEEALYLERSDFLTTSPQEALQRRALGDIGGNRQVARNLSPFSAWRYYLVLPEDRLQEMIHSPSSQRQMGRENLVSHLARSGSLRDFTIPNFSRAILTAARNENLRQMGVASLALKRYQMRQGRWPDQLAALVPELLTEVPVDWMDGKPLRYRLNPEGGYTLYGVGDNGHDDGGDSTKDEVWPTMVPWETAPGEP
jgi:hypothetical protein